MPDYIFALLIFIIWGAITLCIGKSIDDNTDNNPKNNRSPLFDFTLSDWFFSFLGLIMLIGVIAFLVKVYDFHSLIEQIPDGVDKDRLQGFGLSFLGLGLSLFVLTYNYLKEIPLSVRSKVQHSQIVARLDAIEKSIKKIS